MCEIAFNHRTIRKRKKLNAFGRVLSNDAYNLCLIPLTNVAI